MSSKRARKGSGRKTTAKQATAESRTYDQAKGVRRIARERVGTPPPVKPMEPKELRKKPKHKKQPGSDEMEG